MCIRDRGTVIGYFAAMKVKMTQMPQMVSLFNGMGGACAALIGIVEMSTHHPEEWGERLIIFLGLMIGSVSFAGSMIAYGKLEGKIKDYGSKFLQFFNNTFVFAILAVIIYASITACLLYTSDAADERSSVDLGGPRIINKKTTKKNTKNRIHLSPRI